jgi:hypothetical protein
MVQCGSDLQDRFLGRGGRAGLGDRDLSGLVAPGDGLLGRPRTKCTDEDVARGGRAARLRAEHPADARVLGVEEVEDMLQARLDAVGRRREKSIGALYDRAGFEGRHVPHGWRASFSTVMNERGADGADIERALAHTPKDKVKAAYDRSERLQRQRDLFQEWADLLVDL